MSPWVNMPGVGVQGNRPLFLRHTMDLSTSALETTSSLSPWVISTGVVVPEAPPLVPRHPIIPGPEMETQLPITFAPLRQRTMIQKPGTTKCFGSFGRLVQVHFADLPIFRLFSCRLNCQVYNTDRYPFSLNRCLKICLN
jgi:hypothetical protein